MKKISLAMISIAFMSSAAAATDYTVDFSRMDDLETIRPLVESCDDFDALELYRDRMKASKNLEDMRRTLSAIGLGMFIGCPEGIAGPGVTPVKKPTKVAAPEYSVDFTRVKDFETLRPLVRDCSDFGALEHYRDRLESTADLNDMRESLAEVGYGVFAECSAGISGTGITPVK